MIKILITTIVIILLFIGSSLSQTTLLYQPTKQFLNKLFFQRVLNKSFSTVFETPVTESLTALGTSSVVKLLADNYQLDLTMSGMLEHNITNGKNIFSNNLSIEDDHLKKISNKFTANFNKAIYLYQSLPPEKQKAVLNEFYSLMTERTNQYAKHSEQLIFEKYSWWYDNYSKRNQYRWSDWHNEYCKIFSRVVEEILNSLNPLNPTSSISQMIVDELREKLDNVLAKTINIKSANNYPATGINTFNDIPVTIPY